MSNIIYPEFSVYISESPRKDPVRGDCALVSFSYHQKMIDLIKGIPGSVWVPELSSWELRMPLVKVFLYRVKSYISQLEITPKYYISNSFKSQSKSKIDLSDMKWKTKPFPHQLEGVQFGIKNKRFILGDEMGAGKTKQLIDLAVWLKKYEGLKHCLVICGVNGNKFNWESEIKLHSNLKSHIIGTHITRNGNVVDGGLKEVISDLRNPPRCFFYIMNVEKLRGGHKARKRGQKKSISEFPVAELIQNLIDKGEIGLVAFDEIHKCKSPTANQAQALMWLNCPREVGMTGTLIMNSPLDLYVPFKWLGFEHREYWSFLNRYAIRDAWGNPTGYQNAQELIDILAVYQIRRLKKDVLDLPPKIFHEEFVELDSEERRVYKAVQVGLIDLLGGEETNPEGLKTGLFSINDLLSPMTLSMRLRQTTAYTGIVSDVIRKSSKLDRMEELVSDIVANGGKVIVFSNWTTVTQLAFERLRKFSPACITGEIDQNTRNLERLRFQEDNNCKVIIGTIPAMGTGFTLTAANSVIFLDEPWTKAAREQAEDRAHRAGTNWPVDIYYLMAKDTVDEHVHEVVEQKGDMADMIVDGKVNPERKQELLRMLIGIDARNRIM